MLCQVCGSAEAQYTCPRCRLRTCSLACVRRHKEESGCSGTKPRTDYVDLPRMTADTLARDCQFLDKIACDTSHMHEIANRMEKAKKPQPKLKRECSSRGITIRFLPRESSRARENQTFVDKAKKIYWSARWRFHRPDKTIGYENVFNKIEEDAPLGDVLRALCARVPDDFLRGVDPDQCRILMVAEGAEGDAFYEVDRDVGISGNLFAKTVIEYPIFDVVTGGDWKIVTISDVQRVEKPVKPETPSTPTTLPSYDEIEQALKKDIIEGVVADADRNL